MEEQESLKESPHQEAELKQAGGGVLSAPVYFSVSPLKLVVMSICTLGIYDLYWYYKNWRLIKEREQLDIMPFWRAFFAYFFCYSCFKKIRGTAASLNLNRYIAAGPLATGWIIVAILWKLPDPYWLLTYFSVLFSRASPNSA